MVLLQYAEDDGPVTLYDIWKEPISKTLELLEWISNQDVCMFNAAFDHFHISKIYTMFSMFPDYDAIPEDHIEEFAIIEERARFSPLCIKPKACIDVMLHARKGPYQSLMQRHAIKVKRIPTRLCEAVRSELESRIELDGIYFAKRKDPTATQWQIRDIITSEGDIDINFKNIILKFNPSGALKDLAQHALGVKDDLILRFTDVQPDSCWNPVEFGYAPFALAVGTPEDWKGAWPAVLRHHISHWANNSLARKYAGNDVIYTRGLWKYFECPEPGDDDSELACMVAASRWRGFAIDVEKFKQRKAEALIKVGKVPVAPKVAKAYLSEVMDETEQVILNDGTGAIILESIAGKPDEHGQWDFTKGWLVDDNPHPAAYRAREILESRRASKEVELYNKLLKAGRFHTSFKVIGTLSSRMSGADKLNPQGIKASKDVRSCFPLADFADGFVLCGGDFVSFEVVLAEAVYNDTKLREDLLAGKSIHGLFAEQLFGIDYKTIMETKSTSSHYTDGKRGIFSQLYGGNENTMVERLGVDIETATKASESFMDRYPGVRTARESIANKFCSMRQPGGIGSAVEWHEPADFMESLLGFKRYFTLENKICRALFELANNPPKSWKGVRVKVMRRDRLQTASGACQSALFAAAFNIQASNMRQASNHEIQSTGAQITKRMQRKIWDLQPAGVHPWHVQTLNIHDEVHVCTRPEYLDEIAKVVEKTVDSFKERVPLIEIDWNREEKSWADK